MKVHCPRGRNSKAQILCSGNESDFRVNLGEKGCVSVCFRKVAPCRRRLDAGEAFEACLGQLKCSRAKGDTKMGNSHRRGCGPQPRRGQKSTEAPRECSGSPSEQRQRHAVPVPGLLGPNSYAGCPLCLSEGGGQVWDGPNRGGRGSEPDHAGGQAPGVGANGRGPPAPGHHPGRAEGPAFKR